MSLMERSREGMASLSGHVGAALRRRLRELSGIALLSLAVSAGLALATWSVKDPSLSHATDTGVHNLLGQPGGTRGHAGRREQADLVARVRREPPCGRGLLIQLGLFGSTFVGFAIISDWRGGVIERFRVTPISRLAVMSGRVLWV